ncbi:MAG: type IV pilus modification PilV family protein [Nitrospinota bacterium]
MSNKRKVNSSCLLLASNKSGFTLIEVLVAMAVILIAILGLTSLQVTSISAERTAKLNEACYNTAAALLDTTMQELAVRGMDSSTNTYAEIAATVTDIGAELTSAMPELGSGVTASSVNIGSTLASFPPGLSLADISITIGWQNKGTNKTCVTSTLF